MLVLGLPVAAITKQAHQYETIPTDDQCPGLLLHGKNTAQGLHAYPQHKPKGRQKGSALKLLPQ
jgi:hypothetical protein